MHAPPAAIECADRAPDRIELNEAFAKRVLAFDRELYRDHLNVNGGAMALGHTTGFSAWLAMMVERK